jgi:hypothetical protein
MVVMENPPGGLMAENYGHAATPMESAPGRSQAKHIKFVTRGSQFGDEAMTRRENA